MDGITAPGGRPARTDADGDTNYFGRDFEHQLAEQDVRLLRPARKGEPERAGAPLFKPLRQVIESVNETFKDQPNSTEAAHRAACSPASCNASLR